MLVRLLGMGLQRQKVKAQIKNLAKARREMQGLKPMEVDRITNSWADLSEEGEGGWGGGRRPRPQPQP